MSSIKVLTSGKIMLTAEYNIRVFESITRVSSDSHVTDIYGNSIKKHALGMCDTLTIEGISGTEEVYITVKVTEDLTVESIVEAIQLADNNKTNLTIKDIP